MKRIGEKPSFDKSADSARGAFRLERDGPAALVVESVHFFLYDVGGVTHTAQEELRVLKNRRTDLPVPCGFGLFPHDLFDIVPGVGSAGQNILRTLRYLDRQ